MVLCSSLKSSWRFLVELDCVEGKMDGLGSAVLSCVDGFDSFLLVMFWG
jgi:hypothetical protein